MRRNLTSPTFIYGGNLTEHSRISTKSILNFSQGMNLPRLLTQFHVTRLIGSQLSQHSSPHCWPAVVVQSPTLLIKRWKADDRRELIGSMPKKDMGTHGEAGVDIDLLVKTKDDMFPTAETPDRLFNGTRFAELPICHIKSTPNNTIMQVTDFKGTGLIGYRSCGMEGFKNTRKGTNIAAQATAITLGQEMMKKNVTTLRVKIQGIGPGRMSSVKGLQMAGMEIVSLTDNTHISYTPPRAKKQRRL